ncbi:hypothetical protein Cni_G16604 [Canna indica]|uniref:Reverse transcriptase domain-containing protein n=1 Tax=Canna indica TaxID=4628 RepID=A0AAQ3KFJ5_9LILI|nr:hypothetical protein Cni_G16604 [Canna indica]
MPKVYEVIKKAKNFKSPGLDRLMMKFYMKFWPLIGDQVLNIILKLQANSELMSRINKASIVLIPKSLRKSITHIFFADDLLIFSKADEDSIRSLWLLLRCFELCSELKINALKTKVIYINGDNAKAALAVDIFECSIGAFPLSYLGLPLRTGGLTYIGELDSTGHESGLYSGFLARPLSLQGGAFDLG